MVYCRYCGTQNQDGTLKCVKCGKPLSLMPNEPQATRFTPKNNQNFNPDHFKENDNINRPIKSRYMNQNLPKTENSYNPQESFNQESNMRNIGHDNYNRYDPNLRSNNYSYNEQNQDYGSYGRYQDYPNNIHPNQGSFEYENEPKVSKTAVEWDVVIATALLVIILTAILQRVISSMAIFMSMLIGLAYILIATKSKLSLIKSIPLTILVVLAISAYFSI